MKTPYKVSVHWVVSDHFRFRQTTQREGDYVEALLMQKHLPFSLVLSFDMNLIVVFEEVYDLGCPQ